MAVGGVPIRSSQPSKSWWSRKGSLTTSASIGGGLADRLEAYAAGADQAPG
jgi:hypothetical protein